MITRLLLVVALLGGCVAGGAVQDAAPDQGKPHRTTWAPEMPPQAMVLALHGYGDHAASTFEGAAAFWVTRGLAVTAYDHRGFGHNADRGQWPGADRLIADAVAEAERLREAHPSVPLYLLGHSMGGGVALAAMADGAPADGAILVAPAIAGGQAVGPVSRAGLWVAATVAPDRRWTGEGIVRIQASDNIDALRQLAADPLYLGAPSPREILGLVRIMDRAKDAAPSVDAPVLVLIGERDEVISPEAMAESAATIAGIDTITRYPDGWHLLLRDRQAPTVWAAVADWIEERHP